MTAPTCGHTELLQRQAAETRYWILIGCSFTSLSDINIVVYSAVTKIEGKRLKSRQNTQLIQFSEVLRYFMC